MNKGWKRITACILSAAVLFEALPVSASEKRETGNKASQTEIALFSEEDMILDISGTSGVSGAKVSDAPDAVNGTEYTPPVIKMAMGQRRTQPTAEQNFPTAAG